MHGPKESYGKRATGLARFRAYDVWNWLLVGFLLLAAAVTLSTAMRLLPEAQPRAAAQNAH